MKIFGFVLLVLGLMTSAVMAQSNPTVEIVFSQPSAKLGEIITADVYVRNAVNVGGLDIGVKTTDRCLRIVERQPGSYLPTTGEQGAFSALSELTDEGTRFAVALVDRTKHVSGDGIFYQVQLEVMCAEGIAALDFSYAQVSVYVDPAAEIIDVVSYDLAKDTLNPIKGQVVMAAQDATAEADPSDEVVVTVEPETVVAAADDGSTSLVVIVALTLLGALFLGLIFWYLRRMSASSVAEAEDDQS